jgi:hypoxanthine phosphoribosyltransferase
MQPSYNEALEILDKSTVILTSDELYSQIKRIAREIDKEIVGDIPVFLTVMNGGIFFAAELLKQLKSPFLVDYVHASRYRGETFGSSNITWYHKPSPDAIKGKTVYIIDDILDEGYTLVEIKKFLLQSGVKSCKIVVLVDKDLGHAKPLTADYIGISAPNRYLFGFGLDIYGLYRQLPDIYAYNQ